MNRRHFLAAGATSAVALLPGDERLSGSITSGTKLKPPASGSINVAFLMSAGSNVIEMARAPSHRGSRDARHAGGARVASRRDR